MTFLILGATGLQGGAVAREMLKRGQPIRILTRRAQSSRAQALAQMGAEVVEGDLSKPETLPDVFKGIAGVFSVQDFYAPGVGLVGELEQGRAVLAAARAAGVRHIVQSSMGDGHAPGGPEHFISKALLEREIKRSGIDWTLLGTVWFMDNLLNPEMKPALMFPVLAGSLDPDTKFQMLAIEDLGWMAGEALTNPSTWAGRKINLAGDVMTVAQMKETYRDATGKRPKTWRLPRALFRRLVPEFAEQLGWHNRVNFAFGSEELRAVKPDALRFEAFLQKHSIASM
ncbi:NmrA family NAD(P)-binding protein [uncultured Tateyamaria sp.]|uniref:NmrA family NAD(P)-binding protein n=1 Tax=uncultured Tateyamaria sp. TaxID=455651 RepID=UPI00262B35C9|nr:NmrA family NAD(P)-binding protein [uncultured Tateyamaria sp.]